jgi:hypothetical protein
LLALSVAKLDTKHLIAQPCLNPYETDFSNRKEADPCPVTTMMNIVKLNMAGPKD